MKKSVKILLACSLLRPQGWETLMNQFDLVDNSNTVSFILNDKSLLVEIMDAPAISKFELINRPVGYNIPGFISGMVTASYGNIKIEGYADAPDNICEQKAVSEALERFTLKLHTKKNKTAETSSGWACHPVPQRAIENAVLELIERDVALTNWENAGPFFEVPETLWPEEIVKWKEQSSKNTEYSHLKILLSETQNGSCISALLLNEKNNFVTGHASRKELDQAILSAASECMRAAHSALRFEYINEVNSLHLDGNHEKVQPGVHSVAYAYSVSLPSDIQIEASTDQQIIQKWRSHRNSFDSLNFDNFKINLFQIGDRFVARVKTNLLRPIFWGSKNYITKNNYPHFVG